MPPLAQSLPSFFRYFRTAGPKDMLTRFWKRLRFTHTLVRAMRAKETASGDEDSLTLFPELDKRLALDAIRKTGLFYGAHLSPTTLQEIRDFTKTTPCNGGFGDVALSRLLFFPHERVEKEKETKQHFVIGHYADIAKRCPTVERLEKDPRLVAIATDYFGTTPKHVHTMLWWSFATQATESERLGSSQTVRFHFDEFDYRFLYFNFYLSNVDEGAGPHVCVLGSHTKKSWLHLLSPASQSDEAIYRYYGKHSVITVTGSAGSGFIEDAFCFHKATPPLQTDRILLQIRMGASEGTA